MTRHRFDPLSFVFGVLFAALGVLGLTGPWPLAELDLAWVGPGLLVLAGVVVLLTARSPSRNTGPAAAAAPDALDPAEGGAEHGRPADAEDDG